MGWSGGIFSRVFSSWVTDAATTPIITAARHDVNDDDLEAGINACLPADGSKAMTGDLPMGGKKITGLAAGANNGDAVRYEQMSGYVKADGTGQFKFFATVADAVAVGTDYASAVAITAVNTRLTVESDKYAFKLPSISTWGVGRPLFVRYYAGVADPGPRVFPDGDDTIDSPTGGSVVITSVGHSVMLVPMNDARWSAFYSGS